MFKSSENKILLIASLVFAIFNAIFIYFGNYFLLTLPILMIIVWLGIYKLDTLLLFIVFITPISVLLSQFKKEIAVNVSIPAEPLLVGVLIIFILKILSGERINKKIVFHPISLAIYVNMFWILFTTISSSMPVISIKFLIARLWFVIPLFFVIIQFFKRKSFIKNYFWLYIISLSIVISYTLIRHIQYGLFEKKVADFVMSPFYKDHTSYGAVIAMYFPVLIGFLFIKQKRKNIKLITYFLTFLFLFAVVFSYTRAAWLSIVGTLGVLAVILLKIKIKYLAIGAILVGIIFFDYQFQITDSLRKNKTDAQENLSDQVTSMTNISTDASNMERINRWESAIKMFQEKPLLGFGPGTYMFNYAAYQMSYNKTIISTDFGDKGNAHSEYIGPLAEQGILGLLSFMAIIISTIYTAINIFYKSKVKETKIISLMALLGLVTYYFHGFLNNFLDTDKLSVPFWGFTAIIVALDIFYLKEENPLTSSN